MQPTFKQYLAEAKTLKHANSWHLAYINNIDESHPEYDYLGQFDSLDQALDYAHYWLGHSGTYDKGRAFSFQNSKGDTIWSYDQDNQDQYDALVVVQGRKPEFSDVWE